MLTDEDRDYLAAFALEATPSQAQAEAALARTKERIMVGGAEAVVALQEPRGGSRGPWLIAGAALLLSAAAILLVLRGEVAAVFQSRADSPMDQAEYATPGVTGGPGGEATVRTPEPAVEPKRRAARTVTEDPASDAVDEPLPAPLEAVPEDREAEAAVVPPDVVPPRPKKRAKKPRQADATLHAEMAVLRPAKAALRAGDFDRALKRFDDHKASFPDSPLAEERDLGRIEAMCGLGRSNAAEKATKAFMRAHPKSPLRARAQRACQGNTTP